MMKDRSLFSQFITTAVPASDFRKLVAAHHGERHAKGFTCWQQFVSMMFLQFAKLTSLREIVDGMKGLGGKLTHLRPTSAPARSSLSYATVVEHRDVSAKGGILRDDLIVFTSEKARSTLGQHVLRLVEWQDPKTGERYTYRTNHLKFAAITIVRIYGERRQIEVFFKTIKTQLKIKSFVGTSQNALKTQIWTALISILLLLWMKQRAAWPCSLSNLIAFLRLNLLVHRDLFDWLDKPFMDASEPPDIQVCIQL